MIRSKITGEDIDISYNLIPNIAPEDLTRKFENVIDEIQEASKMKERDVEPYTDIIEKRIKMWESEMNQVLEVTDSEYRIEFELEDNVIYMLVDEEYITRETK